MWKSDDELFGLVKERLSTAVVGDILDAMGYQHHFLSPQIKPLDSHWIMVAVPCRSRKRIILD